MSRFGFIVLGFCALSCTSPRFSLTWDQFVQLERVWGSSAAKHGREAHCFKNESHRHMDLDGAPKPRFSLEHSCRIIWTGSDTLIRLIGLSNVFDTLTSVTRWTFGAMVQYEPGCTIYRADTIFARDSDLRMFYDSIPSYIDQAFDWIKTKQREDLPLRCAPDHADRRDL